MKKDSHNPKTLIKSGNMPKVLTSLLTNAIIGYRFAQNGKNVSEKPHDKRFFEVPHDKRFFEVHFCLQLQPTRPVGDETACTTGSSYGLSLQPTRPVGDET